jgi:hypothetical protein
MVFDMKTVRLYSFALVVCLACNGLMAGDTGPTNSLASSGGTAMTNPIVLENDFFRLSIDPLTGCVTGMLNRKTGTDYVQPRADSRPPFIIDAYSANQSIFIRDPFEKQTGGFSLYDPDKDASTPGDLSHLRADATNVIRIERRDAAGVQEVSCQYRLPGGIEVAYTVTVRQDSPLADWQIRVDNRGGETAKQDCRVYRVAFPVLDSLCIGPRHESNVLARPYAQGELIPDPVSYSYRRPGKENGIPIHVLTYIGWASMPWMDLHDPAGGGLYLCSQDPTFQQVDLETWPDRAAGTLTLNMRTYAFMEPGQSWTSQVFAVGIHEGDWHWAADRYREWAKAHLRPYKGPKWVRDESDGWFGTGGPVRYDTYPQMLEDARWLGLNYLQIWSEMLENVGPNKSRKAYYCFLMPDPDRGGEAGIRKGIQAVRKAGGHIGFYYNAWTWDSEVEKGLEQWKDHIPRNVKIPRWWGDFRRSASVFPDGSREAGNYYNGYAGMCPASRAYQDYILDWVVDRYAKKYGADAWYFDSCPVTMFGAARVCFSDEHGPSQPHGVGRGIIELLQRVSKGAPGMAITSETVNDAMMQYNSHALGIELVEGLTCYPRPEIYTYTFPEHAIFSGSCNGAGSALHYYYPDMTKYRREDAMNRVFLMGYRFDVLFGRVNKTDSFHQYVRSLIALRQKIKADIYTGDFRDTLGLGVLPDRMEAKLFRRRDGGSLTLALLDRRIGDKQPFKLLVDLPVNRIGKVESAVLHLIDGTFVPIPAVTGSNGSMELAVPAFSGEVAAISMKAGQ